MCIELKVRDDVSVNQLIEIARTRPVVRTPHVGNTQRTDLFAAKCGFSILWVDTTIPGRDKNANPHLLIRNGSPSPLSDDPRLMSMLTCNTPVTVEGFESHGFTRGQSLVDGHLQQLQRVFPNTDITTTSMQYRASQELVHKVFEIATDALPHTWYRLVQDDGTLRTFGKGEQTGITSWKDVRHQLHLQNERSGWVVPNLFALLFDAVRQSSEAGSPEAWMLSGPDMIDYLPELMPELQVAYDAVSRRSNHYPELTLNLVPFHHFRFAVRKVHGYDLRALLHHVASGSRNQHLRGSLAVECPDLWTRTSRQNYFSQHDMRSADDLYAPHELCDRPLRDVRTLWEDILLTVPKKHR